jgi:hypothetical protein
MRIQRRLEMALGVDGEGKFKRAGEMPALQKKSPAGRLLSAGL